VKCGRCELSVTVLKETQGDRVAPEDVESKHLEAVEVGQSVAQPQLTPHVDLELLRLGTGHA
jgi:hypothetical protein